MFLSGQYLSESHLLVKYQFLIKKIKLVGN